MSRKKPVLTTRTARQRAEDEFVSGKPEPEVVPELKVVALPAEPTVEEPKRQRRAAVAPRSRKPAANDAKLQGRAIIQRKDGRKRRRRTIYLPPALDRRLRLFCEGEDVEVSAAIAQSVDAYLESVGA